jgi:hypothetical protein
MPELSDVAAVRNFLNTNTFNPVTSSEIVEFWKSCTDEEKKQFGREAREKLAA